MVKRRRVSRGGKAAPVLTGTTNVFNAAPASANITVPATTKVGDLILLAALTGDSAPTTPTGYSVVGSSHIAPSGSFLGGRISVFSKTATAPDIGAVVTVSGMSVAVFSQLQIRTYTCGGVDQTAVGSVNTASGTASLSVPALTTTVPNQALVAFLFGTSQITTPHEALAAGGSNVIGGANPNHNTWGISEDWSLVASGSTSTGGGVTDSSDTPMTLVGFSLTLLPS